ncbi:biotin--[acetyl-CoA-carboxylase] ligase [Balneola sp. MJW-20]|uniref:biotin--[acetyl-CoA-carboxylase] ligase n=1 Tax=Gracilimonas aurantiaca TaxID=3234185 RepID=UPI003464EEBA
MQSTHFDITSFQNHLRSQWLGHELVYEPELSSTNTCAKSINKGEVCHGTVVITDNQSGGRGQYERAWLSNPAENLTFSMIFEPSKHDALTLLTMACALSIAQMLESECEIMAKLKWPNDVMVGENKIAGLLTETQFNGRNLSRLVVGIGLNVNQLQFGPDHGNATSCKKESGKSWPREKLLAVLLSRIEYNYMLWQKLSGDLLCSVNQRLVGHGEWVHLIINGELSEERMKLVGVGEDGVLQVIDKAMNVHRYDHEQVRIKL